MKTLIYVALSLITIAALTGCKPDSDTSFNSTGIPNESYLQPVCAAANITCPAQTVINVEQCNNTYIIGLIRQLKACERKTAINTSFNGCLEDYEHCNASIIKIKGFLNEME